MCIRPAHLPRRRMKAVSAVFRAPPGIFNITGGEKDGMMPGVQAWTEHPADGLEHTIRLWPHHLKGEGHYLAVLQKAGVLSKTCQGYCRNGVEKGINEKECRNFCICRGKPCEKYNRQVS